MLRDLNRNPRRWVDESGRVRVIEGWHPSQPSRAGYNVKVDADWIGMFSTLDDAADAAAASLGIKVGKVALRPYSDPWGPGGTFVETGLHLVEPATEDDA